MAYGDTLNWDGNTQAMAAGPGQAAGRRDGPLDFHFQLDYEDGDDVRTGNIISEIPSGGQNGVANKIKNVWDDSSLPEVGAVRAEVSNQHMVKFIPRDGAVLAMRFAVGPLKGLGGTFIPNGSWVQVVPGLRVKNE